MSLKSRRFKFLLGTCSLGVFLFLAFLGRMNSGLCFEDKECVSVAKDCCGCNAGGEAEAINKKLIEKHGNRRQKKCRGVACPQVISDHWSCFATPKCVRGRCKLVQKQ